MFRKIAAFEFRYQLRSPLFWVTALICALLTFGSIASDSVRIGGIAGNVKKNSPFAVGVTLQTMSIFAVFIMAAFVSNVVVRDDETGFGQIVHSTRISRFDYLFGRFTGAFAAGCAAFVSVPLGLLLGSVMPWMGLGPDVPLSDMNGQGHFAADRAWFRAYWSAAAVILVVLTNALWRRGDAGSLRVRLRALPRRLAGRAAWVTAAATMMLVAVGGYIFYNTNVVNEYHAQIDDEERAAEYEKTLLGFEAAPQPRIVDVELNVEIFPRQLRVATTGRYTLENREPAALREIHVRWARDTDLQRLDMPGLRLRQEFEGFNYRIYDLEPPLEAGARAEMRFATLREQRGFRNARNQVDIVGNGHVPQQHADRPVPRDGTRGAAAGSCQAAEVRPSAGASPAQA